jgi:sorbitol-specific phosphotransferase system component IIA
MTISMSVGRVANERPEEVGTVTTSFDNDGNIGSRREESVCGMSLNATRGSPVL